MRLFAAILLGKLIFYILRYFKLGGGSAAPGLYALKLCPDLVEKLCSKIPKNIVITGTNGKTTTARMVSHFAKNSGLTIVRNHTGSNLERGIASTLIQTSSILGTTDSKLGIWELDEAAFNTIVPKIKPSAIAFLNVFRDQLDRYGEIDTVVKRWAESLKKMPSKTVVFLNGDDANILKLSQYFKGNIKKFGVKNYTISGESIIKKKGSENFDFEAKNIKTNGLNGSSFLLQSTNYQLPTTLSLPGIYHIYDFLAAFALGNNLGLKPSLMIESLIRFSPAFGRVEKLGFGYIFLIKNPAGATNVLETIVPQLKTDDRFLFALNDNLADGTDVSWIWDVNFELIQNSPRAKSRGYSIYISGSRADDLAVRLKYADFDPNQLIVEQELKRALKQARDGLKGRLFILPTYTAMLELQSILAKEGIKKHYWKEE